MANRKRTIVLFLVLVPLSCTLGVSGSSIPPASSQPPATEEMAAAGSTIPIPGVYKVHYNSRDQLADLAVQFDIWEVEPDAGYALIPLGVEDVERLRTEGYRLQPGRQPTEEWILGPPDLPCYRDVDELYTDLNQMATDHPHLVHLIDYGDSWRKSQGLTGYDLWVLRVTNREIRMHKTRFFLMANIHGR